MSCIIIFREIVSIRKVHFMKEVRNIMSMLMHSQCVRSCHGLFIFVWWLLGHAGIGRGEDVPWGDVENVHLPRQVMLLSSVTICKCNALRLVGTTMRVPVFYTRDNTWTGSSACLKGKHKDNQINKISFSTSLHTHDLSTTLYAFVLPNFRPRAIFIENNIVTSSREKLHFNSFI